MPLQGLPRTPGHQGRFRRNGKGVPARTAGEDVPYQHPESSLSLGPVFADASTIPWSLSEDEVLKFGLDKTSGAKNLLFVSALSQIPSQLRRVWRK